MKVSRLVQCIAWAVLAFLVLPSLLIAFMSFGTDPYLRFPPRGFTFDWYRLYFSDADWQSATLFSLKIAIVAAVIAAAISLSTAFGLERVSNPRLKESLRLVLLSPTVVPGIVSALAFYKLFSAVGLTGTFLGFVVAHTILATPFAYLCISSQLHAYDRTLETAARGLGATRLQTFIHVTLPLLSPSIVIGAIFSFLVSFDEAVVSFFISDTQGKTLPRKMFEDIDFSVSPVLAAVATTITVGTILLLAVITILQNRMKRIPSQQKE
ncbi:ABC transporter permease [Aestuariivirga sp. YIM B02566]|uniref:ABC transporter permease n=1 Tax=Taklimakanibacter albus TaxID=2800327 RepID=A0ACC5R7V2_9HYPH|nr:ABC transporter permease [Aestuariivirga sp. YIM B02566]MBK1868690.1 ABC transporter permease [Aestuariivirga sp. YIM B02566]